MHLPAGGVCPSLFTFGGASSTNRRRVKAFRSKWLNWFSHWTLLLCNYLLLVNYKQPAFYPPSVCARTLSSDRAVVSGWVRYSLTISQRVICKLLISLLLAKVICWSDIVKKFFFFFEINNHRQDRWQGLQMMAGLTVLLSWWYPMRTVSISRTRRRLHDKICAKLHNIA